MSSIVPSPALSVPGEAWAPQTAVMTSGRQTAPLYQPALMGALFGVPAAFWVHDQLFRVIPPEAPVSEPPPDLPVEQPPEPPAETPPSDSPPVA